MLLHNNDLDSAPQLLQIELQIWPVVGLPYIHVVSILWSKISVVVGLPDAMVGNIIYVNRLGMSQGIC